MIKNIIFDFGDIFINLDKPATLRELEKFGITEISNEAWEVVFQYEMGIITTENFTTYFFNEFKIPKKDLVFAWNSILLDFPLKRLEFIKDLANKKDYRLFLLSNTNDLHISWIKNDWGMDLYNEFKNCFEKFYLSHEIHFRKPNADIYEFVLNENNLKTEESLFIDDTKENTDTADALAINTWHLIPGKDDVVELFTKKENLF